MNAVAQMIITALGANDRAAAQALIAALIRLDIDPADITLDVLHAVIPTVDLHGSLDAVVGLSLVVDAKPGEKFRVRGYVYPEPWQPIVAALGLPQA